MKKIMQGFLCVTVVSMATACSGNPTATSGAVAANPSASSSGTEAPSTETVAPSSSTSADPNQKVVYGEVSEVAGNTFVLKEIKMPEGFNGQFGQFGQRGNRNGGEGTPTQRPSRDPNAVPPSGSWGGGDGAPPQRTQRPVEYTGEEIEVMIPVGLPISTMTFSQDGMKESEVDMNAIKSGSRIVVTYGADGTTIEKVLLMPMGGVRIGGGAPGGGAPEGNGQQAPTIIQQ